jgi:CTP synthase
VVEAARGLLGLEGASSSEFGPCEDPVVGLLTEWTDGNQVEQRKADGNMGGTMRLGAFEAVLTEGSLVSQVYEGAVHIQERHRHRYEVNMAYRQRLETAGLQFSGVSPDGQLPEIVELEGHPWFIGVQFHPELKSRPMDPHPLFTQFVAAAVKQSRLV